MPNINSHMHHRSFEILYCTRNRRNYIQQGLQGPCTFNIACRIILQLNVIALYSDCGLTIFYTHEYRLTRKTYTVLFTQNKLVGCPLAVPISYYDHYSMHRWHRKILSIYPCPNKSSFQNDVDPLTKPIDE